MMSLRKRALLAISSISLALTVSPASRADMDCDSVTSVEIQKKKHLTKSLTPEFWSVLDRHIRNYPSPLRSKGFAVGDFHFNNLGLYYDQVSDKTLMTLNDLDDSGQNYLVGDLLKYLVFLRSLKTEVDLRRTLEAYHVGLQGKQPKKPDSLKELLNLQAYDYQKKENKYLLKRIEEGRLVFENTFSPEQKDTFAALLRNPLFQNYNVLLKWIQTNSNGSSAGMDRYLFWVKSKSTGTDSVIEFKSLKCSATNFSSRQDLTAQYRTDLNYLKSLSQFSDSYQFLSQQAIISWGGRYFLARKKIPNLMNDLNIEDLKSDELQEYADFYASILGLLHSGSASDAYIRAVDSEKNFLLDDLKPIWTEFKDRVQK